MDDQLYIMSAIHKIRDQIFNNIYRYFLENNNLMQIIIITINPPLLYFLHVYLHMLIYSQINFFDFRNMIHCTTEYIKLKAYKKAKS